LLARSDVECCHLADDLPRVVVRIGRELVFRQSTGSHHVGFNHGASGNVTDSDNYSRASLGVLRMSDGVIGLA